jgi:hypothetical protein
MIALSIVLAISTYLEFFEGIQGFFWVGGASLAAILYFLYKEDYTKR